VHIRQSGYDTKIRTAETGRSEHDSNKDRAAGTGQPKRTEIGEDSHNMTIWPRRRKICVLLPCYDIVNSAHLKVTQLRGEIQTFYILCPRK
jgi:hypothetical protein